MISRLSSSSSLNFQFGNSVPTFPSAPFFHLIPESTKPDEVISACHGGSLYSDPFIYVGAEGGAENNNERAQMPDLKQLVSRTLFYNRGRSFKMSTLPRPAILTNGC